MLRNLLCCGLGLVFQDTRPALAPTGGRERLLGETRDAGGKPWPRARVTLITRTWPDWENVGVCDRVDVVSDDEGRFRAELLPCRWYSGFAQEPLADGSARMSTVVEWVASGSHPVLACERAPRAPTPLLIEGLARGPRPTLRARLALCHTLCLPVALDAAGRAEVPPWPGTVAILELLDPDGRLLRTRTLVPQSARAHQPWHWPAIEVRERELQVTDPDLYPVPNATAWLHYRALGILLPLGTVSPAGTVRFRGPLFDEDPDQDLSLLITAPGRATGPLAVDGSRGELRAILPESSSLKGRILAADGTPVAHRPFLVFSADVERQGPTRQMFHQGPARPRRVTTDAEGAFAVDGLAENMSFVVEIDAADLGLPAAAPRVVLACGRTGTSGAPVALGDLSPARLHCLALQFRAPDGAPVAHPMLSATVYGELDQGDLMRWPAGSWVGNAKGQVQLLLPSMDWGVAAQVGGDLHWAVVRKLAGAPARRSEVVTMTRAQAVRGRVVDPDGQPADGSIVALSLAIDRLAAWGRAGRVELPEQFVRGFQLGLAWSARATCDREGRFVLWHMPVENAEFHLYTGATLQDAFRGRSTLLPSDLTAEIELIAR